MMTHWDCFQCLDHHCYLTYFENAAILTDPDKNCTLEYGAFGILPVIPTWTADFKFFQAVVHLQERLTQFYLEFFSF